LLKTASEWENLRFVKLQREPSGGTPNCGNLQISSSIVMVLKDLFKLAIAICEFFMILKNLHTFLDKAVIKTALQLHKHNKRHS